MGNKLSLSASDRINALLDDASFVEVGAYVTSRSTDFNMQNNDTPKDGVITGYGVIGDKIVYVYSQDASVLGGASVMKTIASADACEEDCEDL